MKTGSELTLDDCRRIAAAAQAEARRNSWSGVQVTLMKPGETKPIPS